MNMDCIVGCAHEREANANVRFIKETRKGAEKYGKYFTSV